MNDKNIYQRLNDVRKKVAYVKKDAAVQNYRAVTHDMVTALVREHLIAAGVMVVPTQIEGSMHEAGQTKNGATIYRYEASYQVLFVNIDNPADQVQVSLQAHANDNADKAPGKAVSYAVKYAMLKLLSLETGENEESRLDADRRADQMLEHIKEEATEYIEHNDSLALFLLSQKVGQEVWTDVYNSAPDGKKSEFKKTLSGMERQGSDVLKAINSAILTNDAGGAKENIEDLTEGGKRLLAQKLGNDKSATLGRMMKSLEE